MFADIMTPVVAMGVDVKLVEGVGPVIESFDPRQLHVPGSICNLYVTITGNCWYGNLLWMAALWSA